MTSRKNRTYVQLQPEDGMWAGLQDRIDASFTPLFEAEKNCKNLYELFIEEATIIIIFLKIYIFHDTLPLTNLTGYCTLTVQQVGIKEQPNERLYIFPFNGTTHPVIACNIAEIEVLKDRPFIPQRHTLN